MIDASERPLIIAADTGGTFTDLVLWAGDRMAVAKVPSTPDDPGRAVVEGIGRLLGELDRAKGVATPAVDQIVHGSTVATNAVLERRGARTAFVTNRRFEDLLLIGRQNRPELYTLRVEREPPVVSREATLGVAGRLDERGRELDPLTDGDVADLVERLRSLGPVEAVAVCLLHSYADGTHERRVGEALAAAFPDLDVALSHEVLPQLREFERACATVLNAYVQPVMRRYLTRLGGRVPGELAIIRSDGGAVTAEEAARRPVHTLLSGPAGGVVGAALAGRSAHRERVISFDMGGTSTDVSLIDGQPTLTRESTFAGLPLAVTTIAIHTVGAGGGSVAWVDAAGALKVGPRSAGAKPGPACYGVGEDPTVTDAHVVLGRLPPAAFLGGEMRLDPTRAERAIDELAERLGLTREATARGIIEVANAHMVRAIKVISLERGYDPRDFALVAFGGAGGLHACELAEALGMTAVLIPRAPGLLSAVGMLSADATSEFSAPIFERLAPGEGLARDRLESVMVPLEERAERFFREQGVPPSSQRRERYVDMRYAGQSFELTVGAGDDVEDVIEAFHARHEWRYGYRLEGRPIEWVNARLRAVGRRPRPRLDHLPRGDAGRGLGPTDQSYGRAQYAAGPWPARARVALEVGALVNGPLVVTEYSATTWVPEGWRLEVLEDDALLIRPERS